MALLIPPWIIGWTSDNPWDPPPETRRRFLQWFMTRPKSLHKTMVRFPPWCVIWMPCHDHIEHFGIVSTYIEGDPKKPITVLPHPQAGTPALVDVSKHHIEVVGYCMGWTSEFVERVLRGEIQ